ncbi:MAG: DUF308 domain-containing protein [Acidimicrobiales bacterium]
MAEDRSSLDVIKESRTLAYGIGALTLAAGIVLLFWPHRTLTVVARLSGVLLILTGAADLIDTFRNHHKGSYWGLLALRGGVNLGFGLALLFWPKPSIGVLVWLVGLDFVLAGILGLVVRGQMPSEYRGATLTRSLATIAFGLAIMIWPSAAVSVVTFVVGAMLALTGLVLLWTGHQIGKLKAA